MVECSSTLFSCSVMSNSLWPHGWGQASFPCPKPTPAAYSKSCPSTWWCDSKISCSVIPFSFWPQSLPASGSFPMSHFFTSGGQSIGISASATVLPMNIQVQFPLGWTGWISLQSKGLSRVFSNSPTPQFKSINSLALSFLYSPALTSIHGYGKTIALTRQTFFGKVMSLLFSMLSRLVTDFLP